MLDPWLLLPEDRTSSLKRTVLLRADALELVFLLGGREWVLLDSAFEEDEAFYCCRCFRLEVFESPLDLQPLSVGFTISTAMAPKQCFCCKLKICCTVTFAAASAVFGAGFVRCHIGVGVGFGCCFVGARAFQSSELIFRS